MPCDRSTVRHWRRCQRKHQQFTPADTINARQFDSTGIPIGDSFVVSTVLGGFNDPDIAMNANGEFVIAWANLVDLGGGFSDEVFAQ
ncbi:MAG: hypothetical protein AAF268_15845 [Cyanobacteria bacterium P01_A01_bin.3]